MCIYYLKSNNKVYWCGEVGHLNGVNWDCPTTPHINCLHCKKNIRKITEKVPATDLPETF
jgi:hypothetical protein